METVASETQKKEQTGEKTGEEVLRQAPALTPGFEKIKAVYEQTYGRQMTDEQISNLFKTAQLLEIADNDGIWLFLLANENYLRLFLEAPWAMVAACKAIIKEMQDFHEAQHKKAVQDTQCETARIARENSKIKKSMLEYIFISVGSVSLVYIAALNFVIFKLLAYKVVPNAGFSDTANAFFKLLF